MRSGGYRSFLPAIFSLALRLFMGGVFAFSGVLKLMEPSENFRGILVQYALIPASWAGPLSVFVPWLEFLTGAFLILGFFLVPVALMAAGMAGTFAGLIAMSYLLHAGLPNHCGCFGQVFVFSPVQVMVLDLGNLLAGLWLVRNPQFWASLDHFFREEQE